MPEPTLQRPVESAPGRRRLSNVFIGAFLAVQIAMPLSYYLRDHDYDERFSWRMFSTLRLRDCKILVNETPRGSNTNQAVAIERDVQVAWLRLLERMRTSVVDKYLQRRCERQGGAIERVEFVRTCKDTDGKALPALHRTLQCGQSEPEQTEEGTP
jgi:hypothetical protein